MTVRDAIGEMPPLKAGGVDPGDPLHRASGLSLVFAVLIDASEGWRGVRMKPYLEKRLRQIATDPDSTWEDPDLARLAA